MAGASTIPQVGYPGGFNPRGGQAPSSNDPVKETVQMALDQAKGAAQACSTFKQQNATTMQDLASRGGKDSNVHRVITNTITSPTTGSLQMTYNGKAITIAANSCRKMSQPKSGWFSKKQGAARTIIEEKVKKAKAPSIKSYYGPKGPATAFLDASYGVSTASEAIFVAKSPREFDSSTKAGLNTAIDGIVKLATHVTPDNANEVAKLAGTVKGLIDGAGAKVDDRKLTILNTAIEAIEEFTPGVVKQTAEELTNLAKQSAPATAA